MNLDIVILFVFLISVGYVLYQAITSLGNQVAIALKSKDLEEQLKTHELGETKLSDVVDIKFRFDPRYAFGDKAEQDKLPRELAVTVQNKSKTVYIYVDWDKSSLTDYGNAPARRVIRLNSNKQLTDISLPPKPQVFSTVSPGESLSALITAEDLLKLNAEKTALAPSSPILDLIKLANAVKNPKTPAPVKTMNILFRTWKAPLEFTLTLMLRMADLSNQDNREYFYRIPCQFTVTHMRWFDQIPWNPKPD